MRTGQARETAVVVKQLNEVMKFITIGDPIKSAFKPELSFMVPEVYSHWAGTGQLIFHMKFTSRNADATDQGRPFINLTNDIPVSRDDAAEFVDSPTRLAKFVYDKMMGVLEHELQESFRVNGQYLYHPHSP